MAAWLLLALPLLSLVRADLDHSGCDLNNVPILNDFDPYRYNGQWYPTHIYHMPPTMAYFKRMTYQQSYHPRWGITSNVNFMFLDGSCNAEYNQTFAVHGGTLTGVQTDPNTQVTRVTVGKVMATDYTSTLLFLYEVWENGVKIAAKSNLEVVVRDPRQTPNFSIIRNALRRFCGASANSYAFFQPLDFDWGTPCSNGNAHAAVH